MNIVDIIIIAVVLLVIYLSAKKGFVATCLDTLSIVVSSIAARFLSGPIATAAYDSFIGDLLKTELKQALDEMSSSLTMREKAVELVKALPESAVKISNSFGIDVESLAAKVNVSTEDELISAIADTGFGRSVMISFVEIIAFAILFVVITLAVRVFSNFFKHILEKLPVVGTLDTALGGILGLVKAAVILIAITVVLYALLHTAEPGSGLMEIGNSKIYNTLLEYSSTVKDISQVK